jgi:phosphate transport system substrate-binding protein
MRRCLIIVAFALASGLPGCAHSSDGSSGRSEKIVLTGASTIAPLAAEIGKRFESLHPGVRVDVQTGGSSRGVADVRQGLNSIGMVSRPLKENERDLNGFAIANDGVSIILHQSNPVQALTNQQVVDIYTGKITDWSQVGGNDAPITVVNKAEGRSTLELFTSYFKLKNSDIKAHVVIGDNEQGIKTVAGNPNSIGYVSIGTAEFDVAKGERIKLLGIGGVEATSANVASGKFPLSRPLNLVTKAPPEGLVKEFIEFAQSPQVHDLVREQSFVPLVK